MVWPGHAITFLVCNYLSEQQRLILGNETHAHKHCKKVHANPKKVYDELICYSFSICSAAYKFGLDIQAASMPQFVYAHTQIDTDTCLACFPFCVQAQNSMQHRDRIRRDCWKFFINKKKSFFA